MEINHLAGTIGRWYLVVGLLAVVAAVRVGTAQQETSDASKLLRHVVLFKFKEGTSAEATRSVEAAFAGLPSKIDSIVDFEWGTNNSPEGLDQGFTHCFFVTFRDEEGRAEYLPHPAHKEFVALLRPHLEEALVVDYWTQK